MVWGYNPKVVYMEHIQIQPRPLTSSGKKLLYYFTGMFFYCEETDFSVNLKKAVGFCHESRTDQNY